MNTPTNPLTDLMTPGEVAAVFRVDPKTVTRWANAGRIASLTTAGGHHRFRRADIQRLLATPAPTTQRSPHVEQQDGAYSDPTVRAAIHNVVDDPDDGEQP